MALWKSIIAVKRFVLDKRGIGPALYRPIYYWLYVLCPWVRTGDVVFPRLEQIDGLIRNLGVSISTYRLSRACLEEFMADHIHEYFEYFQTGYGAYFVSKVAEHYLSLQLSNFTQGVVVDVAAGVSPFHKIVTTIYPESQSYRQDLLFESGVHGDRIGGDACHMDIPTGSVDFITLHNSIEHFEGERDKEFIKEAARLLRPNGCAVILPIFVTDEHINYVNPTTNPVGLTRDREATVVYVYDRPRFMRHYSPTSFAERIVATAQSHFSIDLHRIILADDFSEDIELVLALRLTRK